MNTPLQMFVMMLAGWVNEQHRAVNAYLKEENRVSVPNGLWMRQVARHPIYDFSGFLRGKRFLIHDRDPLYTRDFRELAGRRPRVHWALGLVRPTRFSAAAQLARFRLHDSGCRPILRL